jgi:hypothetical protein
MISAEVVRDLQDQRRRWKSGTLPDSLFEAAVLAALSDADAWTYDAAALLERKRRSPCGLRRSLLEHHSIRIKVNPNGNCIEASVRWTSIARVAKACTHPPRPSGQLESTSDEPRQPAHPELRPNQRLN